MTMKTKIDLEKMKGWDFYGDSSLLEYAPKNEGKLELFTLGKYVSDSELSKEYESRGLMPANPELIAEYVLANPDFKEQYIATHWKDADDKWCFAAFSRWDDGKRDVDVDRDGNDWLDDWWFAGLAQDKSSALEPEHSLETKDLELSELTNRIEALESWQKRVMGIGE